MKLFTRSSAFLALALAAMVATTTAAHAATINVGVTTTTQGQLGHGGVATGFATASTSYNFAYTNIADTQSPGTTGVDGAVAMDPATLTMANSCTAGYCGVIALDADFYGSVGAVTLTLSGLSSGTTYDLTYDVSETQQLWSPGNNGLPTGSCTGGSSTFCDTPFEAGLNASGAGGTTVDYVGATEAAQGASGWTTETFVFLASGSSEVVTFTPTSTDTTNVPAFALLDDVAYSAVPPPPPGIPEPNTLLLLSTGLLGLGGYIRMRSKSGAATKA